MKEQTSVETVIQNHKESGYFFDVEGVQSFALDKGRGPAVLCLHGVPTSSFLYRKVISSLAGQGLRGICFDFPGLGLASRPENFDYSFSGLINFSINAVDALKLDNFHLVVHDIGGPIGFALAAALKPRIQSITILNTWINVDMFTKPLPMRPFEKPVLGEAQLALINHFTWHAGFTSFAVSDTSGIPKEEIYAYVDLLKREDGGKAFLKIMRNFDYSREFKLRCYEAVQNVSYPVQAIWGAEDPGLTYERYGQEIEYVAGLRDIQKLPAKHLLQEDQWQAIASNIADIAAKSQTV
jgi:pimeloyl-ACP methyl ester carboxylesterase